MVLPTLDVLTLRELCLNGRHVQVMLNGKVGNPYTISLVLGSNNEHKLFVADSKKRF